MRTFIFLNRCTNFNHAPNVIITHKIKMSIYLCIFVTQKRRGKRMEVPQMCDENIDSFFDISHAKIPSSTPAAKPPPKKQQKAREKKKLSETLDESVFSSLSAVSSLTSLSSGEEDDDVISGMSDSEVSEVQNCTEEKHANGEEKPENGEMLASEDSFDDVVVPVSFFYQFISQI